MPRREGRILYTKPLHTPEAKNTLTGLPGRAGEESRGRKSHEGHNELKKQTPKNIGMFKGRSCDSTQLMEKSRKGLTMKLRVVHQKD